MAIVLVWGAVAAIFKMAYMNFQCPNVSANNIDRKLIIVSLSLFAGSRNPNMAIILVCGGCGSHFQND